MKRYDDPVSRSSLSSAQSARHVQPSPYLLSSSSTPSAMTAAMSVASSASSASSSSSDAMSRRPTTFGGNTRTMLMSIRDNLSHLNKDQRTREVINPTGSRRPIPGRDILDLGDRDEKYTQQALMKIRESIQQFEKNESKPPHSSLDRHLVQPQHPGQPLHHQYAPPPAPSVHQQYPQHQQQPPPPFSSNQMPPQLTNPHVQLATQLTVTNRSQPGVRRKSRGSLPGGLYDDQPVNTNLLYKLVNMGYEEEVALRALKQIGNQSLDAAVNLIEYGDKVTPGDSSSGDSRLECNSSPRSQPGGYVRQMVHKISPAGGQVPSSLQPFHQVQGHRVDQRRSSTTSQPNNSINYILDQNPHLNQQQQQPRRMSMQTYEQDLKEKFHQLQLIKLSQQELERSLLVQHQRLTDAAAVVSRGGQLDRYAAAAGGQVNQLDRYAVKREQYREQEEQYRELNRYARNHSDVRNEPLYNNNTSREEQELREQLLIQEILDDAHHLHETNETNKIHDRTRELMYNNQMPERRELPLDKIPPWQPHETPDYRMPAYPKSESPASVMSSSTESSSVASSSNATGRLPPPYPGTTGVHQSRTTRPVPAYPSGLGAGLKQLPPQQQQLPLATNPSYLTPQRMATAVPPMQRNDAPRHAAPPSYPVNRCPDPYGQEQDSLSEPETQDVRTSPEPQRKHSNGSDTGTMVFNGMEFHHCQPYTAQAYKFYMEQHIENIFKTAKTRLARKDKLEIELDTIACDAKTSNDMRKMLYTKETNYLRLNRSRIDKEMFKKIKTLGIGAFGEVALVQKRDSSHLFAMKTLRKSDVLNRNQVAHVKAERDILAEACNEWVVKLYYSFQDAEFLYFVMEYICGGDMMSLLIKLGVFSEELACFYIAELVLAIESVHSMGFIHRDIKPDNILITRDGHIKLTDFGLCTGFRWTHNSKYYQRGSHIRQDSMEPVWSGNKPKELLKPLQRRELRHQRCLAHSLVGTPNYIAPEVLMKSGYTSSCDWWSVGVILYEMLVGHPPFLSNRPEETQMKVINWKDMLRIPERPVLANSAVDLILNLCCGAGNRLGCMEGASEIKSHAFFHGIDFPSIRLQKSPYVPIINSPTDTSNFDTEDLDLSKVDYDTTSVVDGPEHAFYEFTFRRFFDDAGNVIGFGHSDAHYHPVKSRINTATTTTTTGGTTSTGSGNNSSDQTTTAEVAAVADVTVPATDTSPATAAPTTTVPQSTNQRAVSSPSSSSSGPVFV